MNFFRKTENTNNLYNDSVNLSDLANMLETDKGTADKATLSWGKNWPDHETMGYTETYEKYMKHNRENSIKLFEIGICDQRFPYASTKLWLSYFKNLDLYCADNFWGHYLEDKIEDIKNLNSLGVNFIYADQGNFCDWNELKQKCPNDFDYFIEDGSHWPNHMAVTLWQACNMMKSNGYYFMEDIQNPEKSRGKFKYDNTLLAEDLLKSLSSGVFWTHFLNEKQIKDINDNFKLIEMVLDKHKINYLAVFKKK